MRIAYVHHTRFPTEKAHGFQVASVCHALASLGHEVTLLAPDVVNNTEQDPHDFYGLPRSFEVRRLPTADALQSRFVPGKLAFYISMRSYRRSLTAFFRRDRFDLLYLRSPLLLSSLLATGIPVILELHALPRTLRPLFARRCNRCRRVVCLTRAMRDELLRWGAQPRCVTVEADAVDPARFDYPVPAYEAKERWKLPAQFPIVGYAGSLVTQDTIEKGIRELIDALALLWKRRAPFFGWIVGGPSDAAEHYRQYATERGISSLIRFQGPVPPARIPQALAAMDVCVYPAPGPPASAHPYFRRDTSPLKLFEYLAAGKPVVCADLPPLHDVVDEELVSFFQPGDASSLARALEHALTHLDESRARGRKGRILAQEHTWEGRMKRIVSSIE